MCGGCATVFKTPPRRVGAGGYFFLIPGGRTPTGLEPVAWAKRAEELGAGEIVLTSMDADGTNAGYDLPITRAVAVAVGIPVVACGGAGTPQHMADAIAAGADAVLAAGMFHFGKYTIPQAKRELAALGVRVRIVEPGTQ